METESFSVVVEETSITVIVTHTIDFVFCFLVLILQLESTFLCWNYFGSIWSLKLWSSWFCMLRHCHFWRFYIVLLRFFTRSLFNQVIFLLLFFFHIEFTSTHRAHRVFEIASNFVQQVVIIDRISSPFLNVRSSTLVPLWDLSCLSLQLFDSIMALLVSWTSLPYLWIISGVSQREISELLINRWGLITRHVFFLHYLSMLNYIIINAK